MNPQLLLAACEARDPALVQRLLQEGQDPNQAADDGVTPLIIAAHNGDAEIVNTLLMDRRLDPNQAMNDGATALFVAAEIGRVNVINALVSDSRLNPNQARNDSANPLFIAAQNGNVEVVAALLRDLRVNPNHGAGEGDTPLFIAAQNGHVAIVIALLQDSRVNPNQETNNGATTLLMAATEGRFEVVEALLRNPRVDPNQAAESGITPLLMAVQESHIDIAQILRTSEKFDRYQAANCIALDLLMEEQHSEQALDAYVRAVAISGFKQEELKGLNGGIKKRFWDNGIGRTTDDLEEYIDQHIEDIRSAAIVLRNQGFSLEQAVEICVKLHKELVVYDTEKEVRQFDVTAYWQLLDQIHGSYINSALPDYSDYFLSSESFKFGNAVKQVKKEVGKSLLNLALTCKYFAKRLLLINLAEASSKTPLKDEPAKSQRKLETPPLTSNFKTLSRELIQCIQEYSVGEFMTYKKNMQGEIPAEARLKVAAIVPTVAHVINFSRSPKLLTYISLRR